MIGPGREGQDWSTSFVPSAWNKHRAVTQSGWHEAQTELKPAAVWMGFVPDTKATFSLSTVRTSTARTHSALPEPERQTEGIFRCSLVYYSRLQDKHKLSLSPPPPHPPSLNTHFFWLAIFFNISMVNALFLATFFAPPSNFHQWSIVILAQILRHPHS